MKELDMEVGLNKRLRTYTAEEILAVAKNEYEQWIVRVPLVTFEMRRGPKGGVRDGFYDTGENMDFSSRTRVSHIAERLMQKQMEGFRLKYTPERSREHAYLRPLYPPEMDVSAEVIAKYEYCKFTEEERKAVSDFMTAQGAEHKLDVMFTDEILKWTKLEDSDRISYFSNEQNRLMGRRTVKTLASYLKPHLPETTKDHELRELHSAVTAMHHKKDRYEIHLAKNAKEIIDIYEKTNFSSCMKLGGEYIQEGSLNHHPVEVYESPDIAVYGVWDKSKGMYVARSVTNANTKEYAVIYPNDGSGSRKTAADRLRTWFDDNNISRSNHAIHGCRFPVIEDSDGYLMPYVDGGGPSAVILRDGTEGIFLDGETRHEHMAGWKNIERFGAQPTRGFVNDSDSY